MYLQKKISMYAVQKSTYYNIWNVCMILLLALLMAPYQARAQSQVTNDTDIKTTEQYHITARKIAVIPPPKNQPPAEVQDRPFIFPQIKINPGQKIIENGGELEISGRIFDVKEITAHTTLIHTIKTVDNKTLYEETEVITAYNGLRYTKTFTLPLSLPTDTYLVQVEMISQDKRTMSAVYIALTETKETDNIATAETQVIPTVASHPPEPRAFGLDIRSYWLLILLSISLSIVFLGSAGYQRSHR